MDMDDPWGSPWADEFQPQQPATTKESHDSVGPIQRPQTPVKASSLALQGQTNSPWDEANDAEDDGFGDWGAVPHETAIGLDAAHDGWQKNLDDNTRLTTTDINGFSAAWNDPPAGPGEDISKLAPSLLPKSTDVIRQPSPDPWAFDGPSDEKPKLQPESPNYKNGNGESENSYFGWGVEGSPVETDGTSKSKPETSGIGIEKLLADGESPDSAIIDGPHKHQLEISNGSMLGEVHNEQEESLRNELEILPETEDATFRPPIEEQKHNGAENLNDLEENHDSPKLVSKPEQISTSPSSSPSEESHHEDIFSDSPRTSVEEDSKRPHLPRKVSSKVQELVEHFDTLAKKDEVPEIISGRTSVAEGLVEASELQDENMDVMDDMDDFGDFEDSQSEIVEFVEETGTVDSTPPTPESKVVSRDEEPVLKQSPKPRTPKKEYGPVDFTLDTSVISKLYPEAEDEASTESCFIPDKVPADSFTSTEQRKTWYRLIRYGPMRKHNMGDDENYVRVNWTQSEVRMETLKVVARWIEEDRISGRVVLGGGSKAGSMFGWNDQKADPASISAAFASKTTKKKAEAVPLESSVEVPREWPQGLVRDRSTSKGRSSSKGRRRSLIKAVKPPEKAISATQSPIADFGWNTSSANSPQKPHSRASSIHRSSGSISNAVPLTNSPSPIQKRSSLNRPSSVAGASKPVRESSPHNSISAAKTHTPMASSQPMAPEPAKTPSAAIAHFSNDDDDWGDMMSSPVTSTAPYFPQSKGLRHKKSQSFGGAFEPSKQPSAPVVQAQSINLERGHRPTVSFDQILMPERRSAQIGNSPEVPNLYSAPLSAFSPPVDTITPTQTIPAGNDDPWASVDFSFFESAPTAPPPPKAAPAPEPLPVKTVSFASTRASISSPGNHKPKEEIEQDRIVQSVVQGLPDLSYMLR
ncbi:hypothetical protein LSUE1_G006259 [Lachnellula suecica]|uniref:Uncharacterized protein n=1 Tax=Lachnellula suecica TaxID=602035 RepID=A0A8T9CBE8_9HELO|nr:hypothetical protein LSUE1_G006259 [Lachnellula suecica]